MIIGVPREIKTHEYRVSVTPHGAAQLIADGHAVLCEPGLGLGSGFSDDQYRGVGAVMKPREELFNRAELIVKVKEPLAVEYDLLQPGQTLFTYLHLAPNPPLLQLLLQRQVAGFAYETLEDHGGLPLLAPMSAIAGRISILAGSYYLQKPLGGMGLLPTGAPGVAPASVLILGAGDVGSNAARVAHGLGMNVTVMNRGMERLIQIDTLYGGAVHTLPATEAAIRAALPQSDMVIGAVLIKGERAPRLITREMLSLLRPGSVIVDVSIDQGGCFETSHPTTHDDPVYEVDGVIHYAVANMPGAYPRTSTLALTNATLPYVRRLAALGAAMAATEDAALRTALNTWQGGVVHEGLALSVGAELKRID